MSLQSPLSYRQLFPWLVLFRAISLAVSARQIIAAIGAVCALGVGQMVLDWIMAPPILVITTGIEARQASFTPLAEISLQFIGSPSYMMSTENASQSMRPWEDVVRALIGGLNRQNSFGQELQAIGRFLWFIVVWSFFGLILSRLAARRVVLDSEGSLRKAIQFGITRLRNAVTSPLLPVCAAAVLIAIAILASFPARIPFVGTVLVMIVSPIVLLCSLSATFLILATAIGWPLMVTAIAYDDCDGFGGLSRSYSLWTGRVWQFAWYWIVAATAGSIAMFVVGWLGVCTSSVADFVLNWGMGSESDAHNVALSTSKFLLGMIVTAYGISYFWTCATLIYALLRSDVDRLPFSSIAPDDDARPAKDPLPVVGMPAMDAPIRSED